MIKTEEWKDGIVVTDEGKFYHNGILKEANDGIIVYRHNGKVKTAELKTVIYEAFIGKIKDEQRVEIIDKSSPISLYNITLLPISDPSINAIGQFAGLLNLLKEAGLTIKDFKFLSHYKDLPHSKLPANVKVKWQEIMYKIVGVRSEFMKQLAVCLPVENLLDDCLDIEERELKEVPTMDNFYTQRLSYSKSNFKRLCSKFVMNFDDFDFLIDEENSFPRNKKFYPIPKNI